MFATRACTHAPLRLAFLCLLPLLAAAPRVATADVPDGATLEVKAKNIRWTIPDGSPFTWVDPGGGAEASHRVARAQMTEGEHTAVVYLSTTPADAGFLGHAKVPKQVEDSLRSNLDSEDESARKELTSVPFAGLGDGAGLRLQGMRKGKATLLETYIVDHQGIIYTWVILIGTKDDSEGVVRPALNAFLEGFAFIDADRWASGPVCVWGVHTTHTPRTEGVGKALSAKRNGVEAKKPASMCEAWRGQDDNDRFLVCAWLQWSEDRKACACVAIGAFPIQEVGSRPRLIEESLAKRREKFEKALTEPVFAPKPGQKVIQPARFKGGRGYTYTWRGASRGMPFREGGWFVKKKKFYYHVLVQYVGEDAEEALADVVKNVLKSVKLSGT